VIVGDDIARGIDDETRTQRRCILTVVPALAAKIVEELFERRALGKSGIAVSDEGFEWWVDEMLTTAGVTLAARSAKVSGGRLAAEAVPPKAMIIVAMLAATSWRRGDRRFLAPSSRTAGADTGRSANAERIIFLNSVWFIGCRGGASKAASGNYIMRCRYLLHFPAINSL